jgi:hypothetical protein
MTPFKGVESKVFVRFGKEILQRKQKMKICEEE